MSDRETAFRELVVGGAAYWLVSRDPAGRVVSVDFVRLDRVRPSRSRRRPFSELRAGYERREWAAFAATLAVVLVAAALVAFLALRTAP